GLHDGFGRHPGAIVLQSLIHHFSPHGGGRNAPAAWFLYFLDLVSVLITTGRIKGSAFTSTFKATCFTFTCPETCPGLPSFTKLLILLANQFFSFWFIFET